MCEGGETHAWAATKRKPSACSAPLPGTEKPQKRTGTPQVIWGQSPVLGSWDARGL